MTVQEGQSQLVRYVEKEIARSGFWIFYKRKIELSLTRILEPYEKTVNLPLPEKIHVAILEIDKRGIYCNQEDFIEWKAICATAITYERVFKSQHVSYLRSHLLLILHSGEIIAFLLEDISHLRGLLGHFIELYKLENKDVV